MSCPARPDHSWQTQMVEALLDSSMVVDRQPRALLVELIGDGIGRRVFLREQPTALLDVVEIVRFCMATEGGLSALLSAVRLLAGRSSRTTETVERLVAEWESARGQENQPTLRAPGAATVPRTDGSVGGPSSGPHRDFFVSYTSADGDWANWIAWELEAAGFSVLVQEWDFVAGSNWQFAMDRGVTECARTVAVLTPAYVGSVYGRLEAHVAQGLDPLGVARRLIPVRVTPFAPGGLLSGVVYIDLVDLAPEDARRRLLDGVGGARSGRAKPLAPPRFPG
ncbi:toll/interleukin-1 receptor domain-containing protein [Streptomyces sp. GTA36]